MGGRYGGAIRGAYPSQGGRLLAGPRRRNTCTACNGTGTFTPTHKAKPTPVACPKCRRPPGSLIPARP